MVDFCRPSSLPGNKTLGSGSNNNNNNNNNSSNTSLTQEGNSNRIFPSVFVSFMSFIFEVLLV